MTKKILSVLFGAAAILSLIGAADSVAAPYPPALGGTGTSAIPASGTVLIGNGSGTYTAANLTPGANVNITNASGSVTISASQPSVPATTTINGAQCPTFTFSIIGTSSASSVTTSSCSIFLNLLQYSSGTDISVAANGVINFVNTPGYITTSTGLTVANFASPNVSQWTNNAGYITTSTNQLITLSGAVTGSGTSSIAVSSSSLGLGSASIHPASDFLASSTNLAPSTTIPTVYVSTFNGTSGIAVYSVSSTNAFITVTTSTTSSYLTYSSSSLNLGSIASFAKTDYLTSSTVVNVPSTTIPVNYVASLNGATGTYNLYAGGILSIATGTPSTTISLSTTTLNTNVAALGFVTSTSGGSNNATGTLDSGAMFNATNTLVSNGIKYMPSDYATNGCAGSSTATTFQGCIYALYASLAPVGGGTIWVTQDVTSTWTGLLSFNINGDQVSLNCAANTLLQYTGTGNDNAYTWLPSNQNIGLNFDFGNPIGHAKTSDSGGCDLRGSPSPIAAGNAMTATSTAVYFGGTYSFTSAAQTASTTNAGAVGVNVDYNINGFGRNLWYGANAYVDNFLGSSSGGNCSAMTGCLLFFDVANNSGERWVVQGGTYTDPGNSTTSNAIYLSNAGTASIFFNFNSADDAQIVCGGSDGQCDVSSNHIENAAFGTYHSYIPIINPSSDRSTAINASFEEFANDTSGANSFSTLIKHGGQLTAIGDHVDNYGGGTITNFSDHSNDNGLESEMICMLQVQGGSLTNIVAGNGNITYSLATGNGCVFDNANSYPIEMYPNGNNTNNINSGNTTVATFDHSGNWTLGVAGASGSLNVQGNLNATGTISQSGVPVITNANASGTSGSIPLFTGAHTINNSSLSQSGGTTFINGTAPILDGGGDYIGPNVFMGPTTTAALGNLNYAGGVQLITTSTQLTAAQFCSGGLFYVASTTGTTTITLPTRAQAESSTCGPFWASATNLNNVYNGSSFNVTQATSGTGETFAFSPGSSGVLPPGAQWFVEGQWADSSTVQGATSTVLNVNETTYQTSTPLTFNGNTVTVSGTLQDGSGNKYSTSTGSGSLASTTPFTTGNLTVVSSSGALATYAGSSCAAGSVVTSVSASGTVTCAPTSTFGFITTSTNNFSGLTNASITAVAPITWNASSVIGFNTSTNLTISGTYTFGNGLVSNATTTLNSSSPWTANTVQDGYNNFLINPDISLGSGVGTDTAVLGSRPNVGIPVPFFTPYQANQNIAFDEFPKGPTIANGFGNAIYGAAWYDLCDSDLLNFATSSYECLHLGKSLNGFANISTSQGGAGTIRPLIFNAFGGNVAVGTNLSNPTSTFTVNGTLDVANTSTYEGTVQINSNNLVDASGNKYSTSTSGGGGVATTTPFTAGSLQMASTSGSLTDSNIHQLTVATATYATIATDTASVWTTGSSATSNSVSMTIGNNANEMLFAFALTSNNDPSMTWNGTATMTKEMFVTGSDGRTLSLFALTNPASGTHTLSVTVPSTEATISLAGSAYKGVSQTYTLDATTTATNSSNVNNVTTTLTTVANNAWAVMFGRFAGGSGITAGSNTTIKASSTFNAVSDTNGALTPSGTYSMALTQSGASSTVAALMASFAPATLTSSTLLLTGVGTTAPSSTFHVVGGFTLASSPSSFTTGSIGGGSLTAGTCASTTTALDPSIVTSTAAFVTTPKVDPGADFYWETTLIASSSVSTRVCAAGITGTPVSSAYNVKIIQ